MVENTTMMMTINGSPENPRNESTTSTCPSWKLYENPFYNSQPHHYNHHDHKNQTNHNQFQQQQQQQCQNSSGSSSSGKNIQCLISARKLAASFWDLSHLTFFRPVMESELDLARAQIAELRTELEYERKARKKLESMNKRLAKELAQERRGREAMEKMCQELAKEISSDKTEMNRMKKEMEEERKMMRMSEVLREERVQMKLADAKNFLEEKLLEFEGSKRMTPVENSRGGVSFSGKFRQLVLGEKEKEKSGSSCNENYNRVDSMESTRSSFFGHERSSGSNCTTTELENDFVSSEVSTIRSALSENINNNGGFPSSLPIFHRKASPETENPHIKRGIKGFVEFPRVVRAMGSKNRQWGTKLECQKAQLRILLKQKSPIRSNSLIIS